MIEIHFDENDTRLRGRMIDILTAFTCLFEEFLKNTPKRSKPLAVDALHVAVDLAAKEVVEDKREEAKKTGEDFAEEYIQGIINKSYEEE